MEIELANWYKEQKDLGMAVTANMIKQKALELSNCEEFMASKGWFDKFKIRYFLKIDKSPLK